MYNQGNKMCVDTESKSKSCKCFHGLQKIDCKMRFQFPGESWLRRLMADLGHGDGAPVQTQSSWSTASSAQPWSDLGLGGSQEPGTWNWT